MKQKYLVLICCLGTISLVFGQDISLKQKILEEDKFHHKVSQILLNGPDIDKRAFTAHQEPILVAPTTFFNAIQTIDAEPADVGLSLWGDATLFGTPTGLYAEFTGMAIPAPEILQSDLEFRFTGVTNGGTVDEPVVSGGQWATQWERAAFGAADLNGLLNAPVRLPFELWDVTNDRQVNIAVINRNADGAAPYGDGVGDADTSGMEPRWRITGRDYIIPVMSDYDENLAMNGQIRWDENPADATWLLFFLQDGSAIWTTGDAFRVQYSLNFGNVPVNEAATLSLPIINIGSADFVFSSQVSGTNSQEFDIISGESQTLGPDSSSFVSVEFTPQSEGEKTALLVLNSNAPSSPDQFLLQGGLTISPPIFTNITPLYTAVDNNLSFSVEAEGNPTFTLLSGPAGLSIDASGTINWTPTMNQLGLHDITIEASNTLGSTQATYTIFVDRFLWQFQDHNNNNIVFSAFNSGKIGHAGLLSSQFVGSGFQFNEQQALFDGTVVMAISETQVIGDFFSTESNHDFATLSTIEPVTSPIIGFDQAFQAEFNDERDPNPIGVTIRQTTSSKSTAPDDDYVIMNYTITNNSSTPLNGLFYALALDWDVGDFQNNLSRFEPNRQLLYTFNADSNNFSYYGIKVLDGSISGVSFDFAGSNVARFNEMNSFAEKPTAPGDIRNMIAVGPLNISTGASEQVAFALVAGEDLEDIRTNSDRAEAASQVVDQTPPAISHSTPAPATSGQSQTISATITDDVNPESASLFFRRGGANSYSSVVMTSIGGDTWQGAIPVSAVTGRGIEYYISAQDAAGNTATFPQTNPQDNPIALPVESNNLTFSSPDQAYRMISVPIGLDNSTPSSVLEDDLGTYDDTQWRLHRYLNGDNREFTQTSIGNFEPGRGFWLITRGSKTLDTGSGQSVSTSQNFTITLQPGWNQIGNPFAFPVNWSAVIKNGNVQNVLVGYQGSSNDETGYDFTRTQLVPFQGYFVNNQESSSATIEIPPVSATGTEKERALSQLMTLENDEWWVQLTARSGHFLDKDNYVGMLENASDEWDRNDFSEAPFFDSYVSLYFPHEDWPQYPDLYTGDFRSVNSEGHAWDFVVKSNIENSEISLVLERVENLPAEWRVEMFDKVSRVSVDFVKKRTYTFLNGQEGNERTFRLIIGRAEFVEENNLGYDGVPEDFSLSQNYPNPFNPLTHIDYELPVQSQVKIVVYNTRGQRVRTLFDGRQSAGRYSISWDGRSENGNKVASGVYVLRMRADDFVETRKLVLVQ